jgi:NTP pyrophosphatase (non-canonical NTP hydrolase)
MSFESVQEDVDEWTSQFDPQYWEPHEIVARLAEETGEIAREVNDEWGSKPKKSDEGSLEEEVGDAIFTLICLANSQGIDLDETWQAVMDKCYGRDNDRFEKAWPDRRLKRKTVINESAEAAHRREPR